ncbi:hypothetical protein [Bradyrhizobium sp. McL0616]|uniref:hypothetical protein n=1 Tax=Bradyrhizobium sp. McL0616 TaxID=3415674 RepID=UPI003CFB288C
MIDTLLSGPQRLALFRFLRRGARFEGLRRSFIGDSGGAWADQGAFASKAGPRAMRKAMIDTPGIGTCTRLCDRQKFGKVMVRTGRLSHFACGSGIGIATKVGAFERQETTGKAVLGDEERLGLNSWPEFKKMRLAADER